MCRLSIKDVILLLGRLRPMVYGGWSGPHLFNGFWSANLGVTCIKTKPEITVNQRWDSSALGWFKSHGHGLWKLGWPHLFNGFDHQTYRGDMYKDNLRIYCMFWVDFGARWKGLKKIIALWVIWHYWKCVQGCASVAGLMGFEISVFSPESSWLSKS